MLLDENKFVVKTQSKALSSKKSFEILNAETGQLLGTAKDTTGFVASLLGSDGAVIGRYKAKLMSLSGGFHVYDKDGKHIAEIQGKMLKAEYKFVTPDKASE